MGGPVFDIQLTVEDVDGKSVDDVVNNYDIGMLGGLGLQLGRFAIEGRYIWGLTDILKSNVAILEDLVLNDTKNRSFQLVFKVRLNERRESSASQRSYGAESLGDVRHRRGRR
jgi:hypothetical protein